MLRRWLWLINFWIGSCSGGLTTGLNKVRMSSFRLDPCFSAYSLLLLSKSSGKDKVIFFIAPLLCVHNVHRNCEKSKLIIHDS